MAAGAPDSFTVLYILLDHLCSCTVHAFSATIESSYSYTFNLCMYLYMYIVSCVMHVSVSHPPGRCAK